MQFCNSRRPHGGDDYARIAARSGWTAMMFLARARWRLDLLLKSVPAISPSAQNILHLRFFVNHFLTFVTPSALFRVMLFVGMFGVRVYFANQRKYRLFGPQRFEVVIGIHFSRN